MDEEKMQLTWLFCEGVDTFTLSIDRQNRRYRDIDIRFSEVVSPDRGSGDGRRRTKLVRRTRNGSSPYFYDSSRPVHPSGSGSHYRSMDGRDGKGEKGSSVPPRPAVPFLSFPLLTSLHHSSRCLLFRSYLSRSLSLKPLLSPSLPLPLPAPPRSTVFVI